MCERAPNQTFLEPLFEPGVTVHGWGLWRAGTGTGHYATYAPTTCELLSRVLRGLKELV
jgi:hypothetical protein